MPSRSKPYQIVVECASSYNVVEMDDGSIEIYMKVPRRFADLVVTKLSDLVTDDAEIREYEPDD